MRRVITFCLVGSLYFGASLLAAAAEETEIIQAAKREGRVVWYTAAGESQQLAQEFERKYPFVKVEVVRSTVYPLLTPFSTRRVPGNYLFDVVRHSAFTIGLLIQRGIDATPDGRIRRDIGPPPTITTLSSDTTQNWFQWHDVRNTKHGAEIVPTAATRQRQLTELVAPQVQRQLFPFRSTFSKTPSLRFEAYVWPH